MYITIQSHSATLLIDQLKHPSGTHINTDPDGAKLVTESQEPWLTVLLSCLLARDTLLRVRLKRE